MINVKYDRFISIKLTILLKKIKYKFYEMSSIMKECKVSQKIPTVFEKLYKKKASDI